LEGLGLSPETRIRVQSLQRLAQHEVPTLPVGVMASAADVGRVYSERIGGLDHEVVLALALDGRNHVMQELELARGGLHGAALVPSDVFRPLMRAGASAGSLIHNHPSGDPSPSSEDVAMTRAVAAVGQIVGITIVDHVIVTRERWTSLLDLGVLDQAQENCP
jgi:DNA repair protein RadC